MKLLGVDHLRLGEGNLLPLRHGPWLADRRLNFVSCICCMRPHNEEQGSWSTTIDRLRAGGVGVRTGTHKDQHLCDRSQVGLDYAQFWALFHGTERAPQSVSPSLRDCQVSTAGSIYTHHFTLTLTSDGLARCRNEEEGHDKPCFLLELLYSIMVASSYETNSLFCRLE